MQNEYRILEITGHHVFAQPLDGVKPVSFEISKPSTYVENEIIIVEPPIGETRETDGGQNSPRYAVIGSRIDPSFIGGKLPRLVPDESDENEYEFERYVSFEEGEQFDEALESLEAGYYDEARTLLLDFIAAFPYHIDAYHHLGIIEHNLGHTVRAAKYFEMGYRIGRLTLPRQFSGKLPWNRLVNRPFLRAAHGYGLALERQLRHIEAVEIYEQILSWNPLDNQGIRYLLPSVYLAARAPQKARAALETHGADGMNLFTRCLLEIQEGRRRKAVRWLCRGLCHNLHVPELVLSRSTDSRNEGRRTSVAMGSKPEASEYLLQTRSWFRKEPRAFLQRILAVKPFARRLEHALKLHADLDSDGKLPVGKERSAKVVELFDLFSDNRIPEILEECRDVL
jgi:tetratricopeptide (TPR) repeat protein